MEDESNPKNCVMRAVSRDKCYVTDSVEQCRMVTHVQNALEQPIVEGTEAKRFDQRLISIIDD